MPLDGNIYALKCLIAHPILRNIYYVMFIENQEKLLMKWTHSIAEFSTLLQKVKNLNKLSYICGDYNIDLLKLKVNPRFGEFFDHIISSGFFPKITLPTRFSDQSATLIDNVFSTNIEEKEVSGILLNHISDHQLLFTYIESLSYIKKFRSLLTFRKLILFHLITLQMNWGKTIYMIACTSHWILIPMIVMKFS